MILPCDRCGRLYDDAECWTLCPHGPLWAPADAYCQEHDLVNCPYHPMTTETRTFTTTVTYNVFEPGERVQPIGELYAPMHLARHTVWTVREFIHPREAGDEATVFLEGHPYGVNAALLAPVEEVHG